MFQTQAELDAYRKSQGYDTIKPIESIGIQSILNPFSFGNSRIAQDLGPPPPEIINQDMSFLQTMKTGKNLKLLTYLAIMAIVAGLIIWFLFYKE